MAASASASSSPIAQIMLPTRGSITTPFHRTSFLPNISLISRSLSSSLPPSSNLRISGPKRSSSYCIKASSEDTPEETSQVGEVFSGLKEKWDAIENKPMVVIYGGGAAVGVWLAAAIIDAIDGVPVVSDNILSPMIPKFMELVGLGYTGWFIYQYLLFKSTRKELADDIEALKKKIIGSE
ncbi:protein CURVATURE THYLAKOID 1A, chloroplastic-like isoform X1 [Rutidosis leptorrhynchoides]|uniref:protein CURVATURE THYLAKOID 1A, chloroplastic-like isoform X1 n=1 Tax=Rutidosis leptorrhynchoides TaxID=125765 RepID=UPI003A98D579